MIMHRDLKIEEQLDAVNSMKWENARLKNEISDLRIIVESATALPPGTTAPSPLSTPAPPASATALPPPHATDDSPCNCSSSECNCSFSFECNCSS